MIDGTTRAFLDEFLRRTAVREHAEVVAIAILQESPPRKPARIAVGEEVFSNDREPEESFEGEAIPRGAGSTPPGRRYPTLKRGLGQHSAKARCPMSFRTVLAEPML